MILQPHLINKLIEKFSNEVSDERIYENPGAPRFKVTHMDEDSETIHEHLQKNYRSGVGMLLYLIKFLRTNLSNSMRELSKCMDKATIGTYQEMHCVKCCCKTTWNLKVFSDSERAGDPETRISVTVVIVCLKNVPVCWHSTAQRGVTLSSSEAEYVAISEAVK